MIGPGGLLWIAHIYMQFKFYFYWWGCPEKKKKKKLKTFNFTIQSYILSTFGGVLRPNKVQIICMDLHYTPKKLTDYLGMGFKIWCCNSLVFWSKFLLSFESQLPNIMVIWCLFQQVLKLGLCNNMIQNFPSKIFFNRSFPPLFLWFFPLVL
jgi:hypothetical protein